MLLGRAANRFLSFSIFFRSFLASLVFRTSTPKGLFQQREIAAATPLALVEPAYPAGLPHLEANDAPQLFAWYLQLPHLFIG